MAVLTRTIEQKRATRPAGADIEVMRAASGYTGRAKHSRPLSQTLASLAAVKDPPPPTPEQIKAESQRRWDARCKNAIGSFLATVHPTYRQCRIENFLIEHPQQRAVVDSLKEYLTFIGDEGLCRSGLVLYGKPGTGKDHLLTAAGWLLARWRAHSVVWRNGWPLFQEFKNRVFGGQDTAQSYINTLVAPDVLIISDPTPKTQEAATGTEQELLYQILDQRQGVGKPTWFSLNVQSLNEAEARIGGPVVDRMEFEACVLECFWPSARRKPKDFSARTKPK